MLDSLYYGLLAKKYEMKEKRSDKKWEKEKKKLPATCSTKEELIKALEDERETIIVKGAAYNEIFEFAKKSQSSKNFKSIGIGAILLGAFILPGISAWIATGVGAFAYGKGKVEDSLKKYKDIDVDEIKMEIILKR